MMSSMDTYIPLDTLYLLALQDLRTERLLAECEAIVIDYANREATDAANAATAVRAESLAESLSYVR